MQIARWRLVLVAASLVALGALGGGLVQANRTPATSPATVATAATPEAARNAEPATADIAAATIAGPRIEALADLAARPAVARRIWRHLDRLVHAEATVDLPKKGLVTYTADGGTLSSVGAGALTVREKTGDTVSVATNAATKVRKDGKRAAVAALEVGDRVVVISEKRGTSIVALHVLVRPADG